MDPILDVQGLSFRYEGGHEGAVLDGLSFTLERGERVGLVGCNGVGKSTFLDLLTGAIQPSSGIIERGESLVIGDYRQEGMDFSGDDTVLDIVGDTRLLGRFLFPPDMLNTKVSRLSGGEKRRLYLLTILMKNPNLLILDEPTNDLDIVTLNILEEYLKEYGGSLIIVSHDRHFLDRVVEHLLVFCGDGIVKDFIGTFSEYRSYVRDYEASQKKEPSEPKPAEPAKAQKAPDNKPRKLSFKEKRELELIESRLPELEELKKTIETDMNSGTLAYDKLSEKAEEFKRISSEIDELETRWLELQNQ